MTSQDTSDPVLIELDDAAPAPSPAEAPEIDDQNLVAQGSAMQQATVIAARRPTVLGTWFWRLLIMVIAFFLSLTIWDTVLGLLSRNTALGALAVTLLGALGLVILALSIREISALARLRSVEKLQSEANRVLAHDDVEGARAFIRRLERFYSGRSDTAWGRNRLHDRSGEVFDVRIGLAEAEQSVLSPLDQAAMREIEGAARQVATITALVPLAFADVATALFANVRMIRRIAEIYGGRSGTFGAWRLTRAVAAHLVATGAVAVGDDLLGSLGGGHLLGKLSRRFGEGLVNGALTARVGVAAIEVCRPMPFIEARKPKVTTLVRRALTGLFEK